MIMCHATILTILIIFGLLRTSKSTSMINLPETCPKDCPLRSLHSHTTVIVDAASDESVFYKNCLLKCVRMHLAYGIASDIQTFRKDDSAFFKRISREHHVVLFLDKINGRSMPYELIKTIKHSSWSVLLMIFTGERRQVLCEEFVDHEIFVDVKRLFKYVWRELYIINVITFFPLICPNKYITYDEKYYDNWRATYDRTIGIFNWKSVSDKLLTKNSPITFDLMKDFPLRASIFYRFPTSIEECEKMRNYLILKSEYSGGYCGLDGLIMADVISKFHFNLTLVHSKGYQTYGYVTKQGKVTGTLGNIVRGEADVAFNSRFLTDYGTRGFSFLMYSSSDALCALVNRPEEIPLWVFPFKDVYDNYVMLLMICSFVIAGVFLWLMQKISKEFKKKRGLELSEMILDTTVAGTFGFSIRPRKNSFILRASCFFSSTIFLATFQGHVNYAFTTVKYGDSIKTLRDLYDSGLAISTSPSIKALVEPPYNELQSALIDRMQIDKENRTLQETLSGRKCAGMERRTDVLIQIQKYYADELGTPLFDVVEECFRTYYLSIIVRPGFPFVEHVKVLLERLQAAGLPAKYYEWTRHSLGISKPTQSSGSSAPRPATRVSMEQLRIAFSILLTGYIISCVVLVIERRRCPCYTRN